MRLLERDDRLALLASHWERARTDAGSLVIVGGESGAGKTSLVQAFTQTVDGPVLWGACDPLATPRPLGPLHDMADQLGAPVRDLLRGAGQSHEIFDALHEVLRSPTVVVVDDLHWADQGTIDLLRFLLRRIGATPSLVIGTLRRDEIGTAPALRALLGDVARSADATSVDLANLSLDAVRLLAADRPVDPVRLHQQTGGNAFFVNEMLEHVGQELPGTVRDAILARTAGIDPEARAVLDLLACAPEAIPDRLLAPLGVGLPALRALDEAGLIVRGRRGVAFRHDLCRVAVAGALPPGAEVALHRRMLDALEAVDDPDQAVLAHHARRAGDAARVLRHAALAGAEAARSGAHTQAAQFFDTALREGRPASPLQEAELLEGLAAECYLLDRLADAIDASQRAMRLRAEAGDAGGVSANHHALSVYHWYQAERDAAQRHAVAAVAVLDDRSDPVHLGHAHAVRAYLCLQASDLAGARAALDQARALVPAAKDRQLAARVELIEGMIRLNAGDRGGRDAVVAALAAATEHFDEIHSSGYSNLSYLDVDQHRLDDAAEVLAVSLPLTVERDMPICRVWQLGSRGRLELRRGDWPAAVADAEAVLAGPSAPLARTWPHLVRGLVALRTRGEGAADLDRAWELARRFGEPLRLLPAGAALVERLWLLGGDDARLPEVAALLDLPAGVGLEWVRGDLAVWLSRLGAASPALGLEVAAPHRLELGGDHRAAADEWARLSAPYERALALADHGGPEEVRVAVDLLDGLGADAVAARVRQDLRDRGVAAVPARRRATTRQNVAGLTERQVDVLRLLANGLTNAEIAERLFISRKTADHHVSAILGKLGVPDRRQAVRVARERQILA